MNPITIDLPLPPECLHPNARPNRWAKAKAVKESRALAAITCRNVYAGQPMRYACYRLIFRLPRKRDYDGLGAWVKAYIDGLADAGLLVNDIDFRPMGIERYSGKIATGGKHGVRFVIWPETGEAEPQK